MTAVLACEFLCLLCNNDVCAVSQYGTLFRMLFCTGIFLTATLVENVFDSSSIAATKRYYKMAHKLCEAAALIYQAFDATGMRSPSGISGTATATTGPLASSTPLRRLSASFRHSTQMSAQSNGICNHEYI